MRWGKDINRKLRAAQQKVDAERAAHGDDRLAHERDMEIIGRLRDRAEALADTDPDESRRARDNAARRLAEWRETYPAIAARSDARGYSDAANYVKGAAGRKALARLDAGEDYIQVIGDMEAEWHAYCHEAAMRD